MRIGVMKDSKTKAEDSIRLTYTQHLPGCVARTDAPVYVRTRVTPMVGPQASHVLKSLGRFQRDALLVLRELRGQRTHLVSCRVVEGARWF